MAALAPGSGGGEPEVPLLDRPESTLYNAPRFTHPALRGRFGAQVAQLVEHAIENRSVGGSIPPLGTISLRGLLRLNDVTSGGALSRGRELRSGTLLNLAVAFSASTFYFAPRV